MNKKYIGIMIVSAFLMAGSIGLNINSVGVFFAPVSNDLEILVGDFSIHSTLISLGIAFGSLIIAPVVKRVDFRLMILLATAVVSVSTYCMSLSTEPWQFNSLGFIRGLASAFYGIIPLQLLINHWFVAKHGLVTSLVFSFSGIAGAIFAPLLSSIIQHSSWEMAYVVQALLFIVLSVPALIFPFKFKPEMEGRLPYGDIQVDTDSVEKSHPTDKRFNYANIPFLLIITGGLLVTSLTGFAQHLSAVGEDGGFSAGVGASMISACMIGNIIFKLLIGMISDRKGAIFAFLMLLGVIFIGLALLIVGGSVSVMVIGSVFFGSCFAVTAVGLNLVAKQLFSAEEFIKVFPIINFVSNIGAAFAVSLYGFSYDFTGSYMNSIIVSMIVIIVVGFCVIIASNYRSHNKESI